jgi:hypothetical protein
LLFCVLTPVLSSNTAGATETAHGIPPQELASINLPKFAMRPVLLRLKHARTVHLPIALRLDARKCLHLLQAPAQAIAAMFLTTLTLDRE